jgi:hypothetical protein
VEKRGRARINENLDQTTLNKINPPAAAPSTIADILTALPLPVRLFLHT